MMLENRSDNFNFCRITLEHTGAGGVMLDDNTARFYTLIVPLDGHGRINLSAWRARPKACHVIRTLSDKQEHTGLLTHCDDGMWRFVYDVAGLEDDEFGMRTIEQRVLPGAFVSVKTDDELHAYKVQNCEPLHRE